MRVVECDKCGETLAAANDGELGRCLERHWSERHGEELEAGQVEQLLETEAYDASDS